MERHSRGSWCVCRKIDITIFVEMRTNQDKSAHQCFGQAAADIKGAEKKTCDFFRAQIAPIVDEVRCKNPSCRTHRTAESRCVGTKSMVDLSLNRNERRIPTSCVFRKWISKEPKEYTMLRIRKRLEILGSLMSL